MADGLETLSRHPYPGRGILLGLTPDGSRWVQVYWITGRSENSRNRILVREGDGVRTAAYDPARLSDPSLIIYRCTAISARCHVVSNGDQTDTIVTALAGGGSFEGALHTRTFEPDAPNYTPRIAGLTDLEDRTCAYRLAILKAEGNDPAHAVRHFFTYATGTPGQGHGLTTYAGLGDPLPPFTGEPWTAPVRDDAVATAALYWDLLPGPLRVALLVKTIDRADGAVTYTIRQAHQE